VYRGRGRGLNESRDGVASKGPSHQRAVEPVSGKGLAYTRPSTGYRSAESSGGRRSVIVSYGVTGQRRCQTKISPALTGRRYRSRMPNPFRYFNSSLEVNRGEFLECFHPPKTVHRSLSSSKRQM
jgi:hypothetical protein